MEKKRCLFCDAIVPIQVKGDYDYYEKCLCSPDGKYGMQQASYEAYHALSYQIKHEMFPIISAYIRELTDCGEQVELSIEDVELIRHSPRVPVTIEDKSTRLLQFFYRHAGAPGKAVVLHQLPKSFNLTYSPNLQELIYIIEKLKDEQMIERMGSTFKLTEAGWKAAEASFGGKLLKPCCVLLPADEERRREWFDKVLPVIQQCGYLPQVAEKTAGEKRADLNFKLIAGSKLVIADLTEASPEVYLAGGYAFGLDIPVIWTVEQSAAGMLPVASEQIRPFSWNTPEELALILKQRLSV
ncbi:hypothetical protein [Paenibacillus sp. FJAT-26967]|uniref:hypothetical protein n=1 Tax=Paenibacillus sp. FJAT-26967 TaxID=1729690 RepID=UPI0008395C16|nr:hypothetical protein [Paenibacillus sp. FJAT-26967]